MLDIYEKPKFYVTFTSTDGYVYDEPFYTRAEAETFARLGVPDIPETTTLIRTAEELKAARIKTAQFIDEAVQRGLLPKDCLPKIH